MAGMVVVGTINHGKGMPVRGIAKTKRLAKKKKIKKRMKRLAKKKKIKKIMKGRRR